MLVREAFIKKKHDKMLQFLKLCLKSISGHSESFWFKKILGEKGGGVPYIAIFHRFLDFENFYKCLTFLGGKKHFFSKSAPIMV